MSRCQLKSVMNKPSGFTSSTLGSGVLCLMVNVEVHVARSLTWPWSVKLVSTHRTW